MRVVCGVDDTPDNGYVLERAMALCKDLGAELVVVTVRQSARPSAKGPALPFDPGTYRSGALEDAATTLQQHAAAALAAGAARSGGDR